ncbi:hypothetical protein ACFV0O_11005 [Kitasatospora sp. NPDC059577]|uniref:hypothetical protein n=1 Tax=Kitasatospora sp. NPDC059577 TaxID=3346873 RepID=UPI0036B3A418
MGFSGAFVVARSARSLTELTSVRLDEVLPEWEAEGAGADDWRILQTGGPVDTATGIVAETGAPVLVMHVHDSDFVLAQAWGPGGLSWHSTFPREMALDYEVPEKWITEPDEIAPRAAAWAEGAGLRPDQAAVLAVLEQGSELLAEDLALDLTRALGFGFPKG